MKPRASAAGSALLKLMATPVRRKYFESLRRMLGPAGLISIREEQFFLVLAIAIGILAGLLRGAFPGCNRKRRGSGCWAARCIPARRGWCWFRR